MVIETESRMQDRRYLLNIEQMLEENAGETLFQEALARIDGERRQKVLRIRNTKAQAASIGAGLLIQKALADYVGEQLQEKNKKTELTGESGQPGRIEQIKLEQFSVEELLSSMDCTVVEPEYRYGSSGKPYLSDYSFNFNLSHSGTYVFCGVSEQEIGVDIQKIQSGKKLNLAKRFFSAGECQALKECEDEETRDQIFFRMWTRKEAYGKLTGKGLTDAIGKNLWMEGTVERAALPSDLGENVFRCSQRERLVWEEYDEPAGYRIAVCMHRN